ncbi:DUF4132 domain-containing protein, partial [Thermomonospora catenispora]|uniref:DUF4132 domain-containing protein n=1 Tax=Thermomonospora catenispora TaxID=2493090 RepID=UPI00111EED2B
MTDESTLVIPEEWHRSVHPRRGGRVPATLKVAANPGTRAARLVAKAEEAGVFAALAPEASDADLIERTRRHLRGEADPAGAAVVAQLAAMETSSPDNALRTFVDAWAAEHGPAFAACAVMELASIRVKRLPDGSRHAEQRSAARVGDDDFDFTGRGCARRVRTLLAGADDADYREAAERLEEHRDTRVRRLLAAYLVPTRHEWVAQCCEEGPDDTWKWRSGERRALFLSLGAREHVEAVEGKIWPTWREVDAELATTLLDGLGADALPLLVSASGLPVGDATRRRVLETVSVIPTDEALAALLERHDGKIARPVLLAAMTRFPMRALRLLTRAVVDLNAAGDAEGAAAMTDLLQGQVLNHPDAAARTMDELPDPCRAVLEPVLSSAVRLPEAPLEALPPLLARPPWEQGRTKAEPVVIPELTPAVEAGVTWQEGERERWAAFPLPEPPADADWEELAARYRDGRLPRQEALALFTAGPEEIVRPLLAAGAEDGPWIEGGDAARLRSILARHELDALPAALSAARARPAVFADLLVPFLDARVAKLMVEWFHGTGPLRDVALRWLDRHGVQAARLLIPTALDRHAHAPRRAAERALLAFSLRLGEEPIIAAAREHGDRAADAIAELLTVGPPDLLPAKRPKSVPWIVPARLPQVPLRGDKDKALPLTAIGHVITLLTLSAPYGVHPGVDLVRELCDPESLAEFSWALFQEWRKTGEPTEGYWALHQLAWFGDDETARRLTPVIRAWPGQSGHRKAVAGLDVLTAIGSDTALLQLHGISEKVKFTGLREAARSKIHRLGETLGLSADQLADRLVPAF